MYLASHETTSCPDSASQYSASISLQQLLKGVLLLHATICCPSSCMCRACRTPFIRCVLLQERESAATNGNGSEHGSNGVSKEQSKQKALAEMAAASSDSDFEKLLSEVSPA